jgi:hypothetical protein
MPVLTMSLNQARIIRPGRIYYLIQRHQWISGKTYHEVSTGPLSLNMPDYLRTPYKAFHAPVGRRLMWDEYALGAARVVSVEGDDVHYRELSSTGPEVLEWLAGQGLELVGLRTGLFFVQDVPARA